MPGKPRKGKAGLLDDGGLLGFLQSTLEAMEVAAGGTLSEERAKLQELQEALGGKPSPAVPLVAPGDDDLLVASSLDRLEAQLKAVELRLATADNPTRQLLCESAVRWGGAAAGGDAEEGGGAGGTGPSGAGGGDQEAAAGSSGLAVDGAAGRAGGAAGAGGAGASGLEAGPRSALDDFMAASGLGAAGGDAAGGSGSLGGAGSRPGADEAEADEGDGGLPAIAEGEGEDGSGQG